MIKRIEFLYVIGYTGGAGKKIPILLQAVKGLLKNP
jgi:hypothetical protein